MTMPNALSSMTPPKRLATATRKPSTAAAGVVMIQMTMVTHAPLRISGKLLKITLMSKVIAALPAGSVRSGRPQGQRSN